MTILEGRVATEDCASFRLPDSLSFGTFFGGGPFVLLFDPITFGSPTGGKEIDVVVNN